MEKRRKSGSAFSTTIVLVLAAVLAAGCGPGQFLGPTVTPSPTSTPIPTATSTPTPTPTPLPTPTGGGSQIVFVSNRDDNWEVYSMESDGSNPVRMTVSPGTQEYFPEMSPDGELLLYWSVPNNWEDINDVALYWMKADGSSDAFANAVLPYTSFAPDGETVALTIVTGTDMDIATVPTVGGKGVQLTDTAGNDYDPAWSPDGKTIAFVSERDGQPQIYLMNADGSDQRPLMDNDYGTTEPAWSPDGKYLAFTALETESLSNIRVVEADGSNPQDISGQTKGYNENPEWSPDGTMLAFWSDRTGNHEIFVIRLDGTGLKNITNDPGEDENPIWAE